MVQPLRLVVARIRERRPVLAIPLQVNGAAGELAACLIRVNVRVLNQPPQKLVILAEPELVPYPVTRPPESGWQGLGVLAARLLPNVLLPAAEAVKTNCAMWTLAIWPIWDAGIIVAPVNLPATQSVIKRVLLLLPLPISALRARLIDGQILRRRVLRGGV